MFCWNCGSKIPDKSKFCMSCGAKIELSDDAVTVSEKPMYRQEMKTEQEQKPPVQFIIQGIKLEFPNSIQEYTKRRKDFANELEPFILSQQETASKSLAALNAENIDNCIDIITTFGVNVSNKMVDTVHQNLLKERIYTVSREQIATLYNNVPQHFAKEFDSFYEKYLEIIGNAEQLKQARELNRAGRSYWQGGGFGIRGALVGAAKAGVLNAGTGLVRGIGDALTDASDRNKAYKNKVALLQSKPWAVRFQNFLLEDMYLMYDIYASLLSEQGKLTLLDFDKSLSQTYLDNGRRSSEQKDQIDLFVRAIQNDPYNRSAYLALGKIIGYDNQELLKTYDYFMASHHIKWYLNIVLPTVFSVKIKSISGASYEELDKKIALEDQQLQMIENLKHISNSFAKACKPYEQASQKERKEFLEQRLTSDDGKHFQNIDDLNLYLRERDQYKKYRQETLTRIVPLEQQDELLSQAEAYHFQNSITCQDLAHWKMDLMNCHKKRDIYSKSFEEYFYLCWKKVDSNEIVARLPLDVQTMLVKVPYISIARFIIAHRARIKPNLRSRPKIDAWLLASDIYIGIVIPEQSETHIIETKNLSFINIDPEKGTLMFIKRDSTSEVIKFLLPDDPDEIDMKLDVELGEWIDKINEALAAARKRKTDNLCPICGQPLFEGAAFCGSCGYKL